MKFGARVEARCALFELAGPNLHSAVLCLQDIFGDSRAMRGLREKERRTMMKSTFAADCVLGARKRDKGEEDWEEEKLRFEM